MHLHWPKALNSADNDDYERRRLSRRRLSGIKLSCLRPPLFRLFACSITASLRLTPGMIRKNPIGRISARSSWPRSCMLSSNKLLALGGPIPFRWASIMALPRSNDSLYPQLSFVISNEHEMKRVQDLAKPLAVLAADAQGDEPIGVVPPTPPPLSEKPHEWRGLSKATVGI